MVLPLRIAAHDPAKNAPGDEQLVLLSTAETSVALGQFGATPMLSFNRDFSAPITTDVTARTRRTGVAGRA